MELIIFKKNQDRKILLLIDNVSYHSEKYLSNIKVQFLPKNTTSIMQPIDQDIIKTFKTFYRSSQIVEVAKCILLTGIMTKINFLDALENKIIPSTIKNCSKHCELVDITESHNIYRMIK